jgi:hypothetical protein
VSGGVPLTSISSAGSLSPEDGTMTAILAGSFVGGPARNEPLTDVHICNENTRSDEIQKS